ncbi:MAG: T9SS type A sorting domain-containing protein [Saprospiraceae bacterium]|nr:T9SS type A sorting domain-containing protein [Saprospiraceae bacterium]
MIYPNPAVGLVNIDLQASEGSKVIGNIYDNVGKLVLSRIIDQVTVEAVQTYSVDVAALNPGVYTIMLNVDGLISSYKLIVLK